MIATMTTIIINSPYNTHHHSGVTVSKYFTATATETSIIIIICIHTHGLVYVSTPIDIICIACVALYDTKSNSQFKTKDFIEIQLGLVLIMYVHEMKISISDFNKFWSNTRIKYTSEIWSCLMYVLLSTANYYIYTNAQFSCQAIYTYTHTTCLHIYKHTHILTHKYT